MGHLLKHQLGSHLFEYRNEKVDDFLVSVLGDALGLKKFYGLLQKIHLNRRLFKHSLAYYNFDVLMMRMKLLPILLVLLWASGSMAAETTKGEELFREGKWKEAAEEFKRSLGNSLESGTASHVSLYNLGTALAKSGESGEAYAVLLRAYFQNPFDADLNHNLAFVEKKLPPASRSVLPNTWISWWPGFLRAIPIQIWALLALLALLPVMWSLSGSPRPAWKFGAGSVAVLFLLICVLNTWQKRFPIASVTKPTQIRSGPEKSFEEIGNIEAGSLVNVEEIRDGWQKIRFQTQNSQEIVGWIESTTTLRVLP